LFLKYPICRGCTKACSHHLDFQYNNFLYAFFTRKKTAFVSEFRHTPLWNFLFFFNVGK
jgi:hypothetical protein